MTDTGTPIPRDPKRRAALYDEASLTADEREAVEQFLEVERMSDLLTPEQRDELNADLWEMVQQRRRAEAESRNLWMP